MSEATMGRGAGQWWPTKSPDGYQSANYYCHKCGKPSGLWNHQISDDGKVTPSVICPHPSEQVQCPECGFHDYITLTGWAEYWRERSWCNSLENWWNQATEEQKKEAYKSSINSDCWKKDRIEQLEQQLKNARNDTLEEAAQVCEEDRRIHDWGHCVEAIRALKEKA